MLPRLPKHKVEAMTSSRLDPLPPEALDEDQRRLYDAVMQSPRARMSLFQKYGMREDGSMVGPFDPWLRSPDLGLIFEQAGMALRTKTEVPETAREVAVLVVAAAWRARFEWFAHSMVLRKEGVSDAVIEAIGRRRPPPVEDPQVLAAHDVAYELVHKRAISDDTYARAAELLGDRGLVEIVCAVGFYQLVSGVLVAFQQSMHDDVEGPPELDDDPAGN